MVFLVAFLPQFVGLQVKTVGALWILAVTFVVMATLNATMYAVFAASARRLLSSPRAQRRFNIAGVRCYRALVSGHCWRGGHNRKNRTRSGTSIDFSSEFDAEIQRACISMGSIFDCAQLANAILRVRRMILRNEFEQTAWL